MNPQAVDPLDTKLSSNSLSLSRRNVTFSALELPDIYIRVTRIFLIRETIGEMEIVESLLEMSEKFLRCVSNAKLSFYYFSLEMYLFL